ncbi:MAG: beta-N-acetylhexosaminidase [Chitinophagales bacterium]
MKLGLLLLALLSALSVSAQIPAPAGRTDESTNLLLATGNNGRAILPEKLLHHSLLNGADTALGNEGYRLQIAANGITLESNTTQGQFYAMQTLQQLIRYDSAAATYYLPVTTITDQPAYSWRGLHLDVCRHFFPVKVVKQYIDLMASLKMNVLHLHLTDDQGWRIEIKKYPRLTEIGAWRIEQNGTRYGGYYTQQDIRDLVAYAQKYYITIVPEIEMPGHSSAAIAAYPQLMCDSAGEHAVPTRWGIFKNVYCPTTYTFRFLQDVLDEVCELFPSPYIHIGGDEVPKAQWKKSPAVKELMQREHLKNQEQVQHYFMRTMQIYLAGKGKSCIGWGEVVRGGVNDDMVVMSWRGTYAGAKAAKAGHKVLMTPRFFCYFDYPQQGDKKQAWWMTYLSLKKVYNFNPSAKIPTAHAAQVMGGQANVWTEHISTEAQLHHQIYPRLAAMAEALWSNKKDYEGFKERLKYFPEQ